MHRKIKEDAIETFAVSEEVYEESTNDISFAGRLLQSICSFCTAFVNVTVKRLIKIC